ncbi:MAG: hypothetical protein RR346_04355 [Bacteroidales bacterium]
MNYLLIGGADNILKVQVAHQYAQKLQKSADFDLMENQIPDKETERFWCVFKNRITQKCVLVNSELLSPEVLARIEHFKSDYAPDNTIVTLISAADAPDRDLLMERYEVMPSDTAVEISLDDMANSQESRLKHISDQIENILSKPPFNLL